MTHPDQEALAWRLLSIGMLCACLVLVFKIIRPAIRAMLQDIDMGL